MLGAHVNYLAVLVSGVAMFVVGGLWYSPVLFARPWMARIGKKEEEIKRGTSPMSYLLALVASLITAWVLAIVFSLAQVASLGTGLTLGALCWLGLAAATSLLHGVFALRPGGLWLIDTGHALATILVAAAILSVWK